MVPLVGGSNSDDSGLALNSDLFATVCEDGMKNPSQNLYSSE